MSVSSTASLEGSLKDSAVARLLLGKTLCDERVVKKSGLSIQLTSGKMNTRGSAAERAPPEMNGRGGVGRGLPAAPPPTSLPALDMSSKGAPEKNTESRIAGPMQQAVETLRAVIGSELERLHRYSPRSPDRDSQALEGWTCQLCQYPVKEPNKVMTRESVISHYRQHESKLVGNENSLDSNDVFGWYNYYMAKNSSFKQTTTGVPQRQSARRKPEHPSVKPRLELPGTTPGPGASSEGQMAVLRELLLRPSSCATAVQQKSAAPARQRSISLAKPQIMFSPVGPPTVRSASANSEIQADPRQDGLHAGSAIQKRGGLTLNPVTVKAEPRSRVTSPCEASESRVEAKSSLVRENGHYSSESDRHLENKKEYLSNGHNIHQSYQNHSDMSSHMSSNIRCNIDDIIRSNIGKCSYETDALLQNHLKNFELHRNREYRFMNHAESAAIYPKINGHYLYPPNQYVASLGRISTTEVSPVSNGVSSISVALNREARYDENSTTFRKVSYENSISVAASGNYTSHLPSDSAYKLASNSQSLETSERFSVVKQSNSDTTSREEEVASGTAYRHKRFGKISSSSIRSNSPDVGASKQSSNNRSNGTQEYSNLRVDNASGHHTNIRDQNHTSDSSTREERLTVNDIEVFDRPASHIQRSCSDSAFIFASNVIPNASNCAEKNLTNGLDVRNSMIASDRCKSIDTLYNSSNLITPNGLNNSRLGCVGKFSSMQEILDKKIPSLLYESKQKELEIKMKKTDQEAKEEQNRERCRRREDENVNESNQRNIIEQYKAIELMKQQKFKEKFSQRSPDNRQDDASCSPPNLDVKPFIYAAGVGQDGTYLPRLPSSCLLYCHPQSLAHEMKCREKYGTHFNNCERVDKDYRNILQLIASKCLSSQGNGDLSGDRKRKPSECPSDDSMEVGLLKRFKDGKVSTISDLYDASIENILKYRYYESSHPEYTEDSRYRNASYESRSNTSETTFNSPTSDEKYSAPPSPSTGSNNETFSSIREPHALEEARRLSGFKGVAHQQASDHSTTSQKHPSSTFNISSLISINQTDEIDHEDRSRPVDGPLYQTTRLLDQDSSRYPYGSHYNHRVSESQGENGSTIVHTRRERRISGEADELGSYHQVQRDEVRAQDECRTFNGSVVIPPKTCNQSQYAELIHRGYQENQRDNTPRHHYESQARNGHNLEYRDRVDNNNIANSQNVSAPQDGVQERYLNGCRDLTGRRCEACGITFDDEVLHSIHMGCHSHLGPYVCNLCSKSCGSRHAFYTHILRGHHPV